MEKKKGKIEEKTNLEIIEEATGIKEDHFISAGERIFYEMTYRGIDWLFNSTTGVAFTYWTVRTHSGQKYFGQPVYNFFEKQLAPFIKDPEKLKEGANWGSAFASIMVGGFTSIPPVMAMEANKLAIIKGLDERIYGKEVIENDPKFADAYRKIAEEPDKDFTGGMVTRFVSLAPLLYVTVQHPKPMDKYIYSPIGNATKWLAESVGIRPKGLMNQKMLAEDGKTMVSDWDFIHNKIGFDFGLTFFYSFLHEYTYRAYSFLFGKSNKENNVFGEELKQELKAAEAKGKLEATASTSTDRATATDAAATEKEVKNITQDGPAPAEGPTRRISTRELAYDTAVAHQNASQLSTGHA